jgi:hypothetical protein
MKQEIEMVPIGKIRPDSSQPRTEWDEHQEHVEELAASYFKHGIIQPLEVDENNVIVLGECRWRAAKRAGLKKVPVRRITTPPQQDRLERQLIDDAQRSQLNEQERMWAYAAAVASINDPKKDYTVPQVKRMWKRSPRKLLTLITLGDNSGRSQKSGQAELAHRIGIPQTTISYLLAYFDERVPDVAREAADAGLLGPSEVFQIRRVKTEKAKKAIVASVAKERKSGRTQLGTRVVDRVHAIRSLEKDAEAGKIEEPSEELIEAVAKAEVPPEVGRYVAEVEPEFQPTVIRQAKAYDAKQAADAAREIASRMPRRSRVEVTQEQLQEIQMSLDAFGPPDTMGEAIGPEIVRPPKLDVPLSRQYHQQRMWNLWQLVGQNLSERSGPFHFDVITTGFSQKSLEGLLEALQAADVRLVIDVRKNPHSQYRPEFNKGNLSDKLDTVGIGYEHITELGIPRELRNRALSGEFTAEELFDRYEQEILTEDLLQLVEKRAREKGPIALLCTEVSPKLCHRHKIALALKKRGLLCYDV